MINAEVLNEMGITDPKVQKELAEYWYYDLEEQRLKYEDTALTLHCKPVYNFQSIEFDWTVDMSEEGYLDELKEVYKDIYQMLQECVPESQQINKNDDLISDSQKALMKKLGLKYSDSMSMEEARIKIKNHLQK